MRCIVAKISTRASPQGLRCLSIGLTMTNRMWGIVCTHTHTLLRTVRKACEQRRNHGRSELFDLVELPGHEYVGIIESFTSDMRLISAPLQVTTI